MSADTFVSQAAPAGIFRSSETKVRLLSSDGNTIVLSMPALNTEENVINSTQIKQVTFNRFGVVRIYGRDGEKLEATRVELNFVREEQRRIRKIDQCFG